ncbi:MAG: glycosyl transferase family protein [Inquilinus sp.]|nr:glycosyl transferase family protein [Inquilinus sp.]
MATAEQPAAEEHRFAGFVRVVAKGSKLSRALSRDEAETAMRMILAGAAEPVQIGAFLAVLRYRKETAEELAGFVAAARDTIDRAPALRAELDWPSYADRHKQLPYFLLAALLLAANGVRVLIHCIAGDGPASTPACLAALGIRPAASAAEAAAAIDRDCFAYLPLGVFCPALDALFDLRPLLGLRSPANTYARELNPAAAPCQMQGVFHPNYIDLHQTAARLLGQPQAAIFKGAGGEAQRNPNKPCRVALLSDGVPTLEEWAAVLPDDRFGWREEPLRPDRLVSLWRGEDDAAAPTAAIVGTAAIALRLLGRTSGQAEAEALAREMWTNRPKSLYPARGDR